jgi:hypothetical protein
MRSTASFVKTRLFFPETACEFEDFSIGCPSNQRLHIISALYGRTSDIVCIPDNSWYMRDLSCTSPTAEDNIKGLCNNKQSCAFIANTVSNEDPCPGTYKYLDVKYQCLLMLGELTVRFKLSNFIMHFGRVFNIAICPMHVINYQAWWCILAFLLRLSKRWEACVWFRRFLLRLHAGWLRRERLPGSYVFWIIK